MRFVSVTSSVLVLLLSKVSFAQSAEPSSASSSGREVAAGCSLDTRSGVDENDAFTAARLACSELAKVSGRTGKRFSSYRVHFGKLGSRLVMTIQGEEGGKLRDERSAELAQLEEVTVVAPRLAEALLTSATLEDTRKVSNITDAEARTPRTMAGATRFGLGVFGAAPVGQGVQPAAGADLSVFHESATGWGAGAFLRAGGGRDTSYVAIGAGGRHVFGEGDIGPLVGFGLQWMSLSVDRSSPDKKGSGLAAYGEVGVEMLRMSKSRLVFAARVEAPFFTLDKEYVVPVGVGASFYFN